MCFEISLLGKTLERQTNKSTQKEKNTEVKRCTQKHMTYFDYALTKKIRDKLENII